MISEPNEILKTGLAEGKPYLGSPTVVVEIIKRFLLDLTDARTEQVKHGINPMPVISDACKQFQNVFYGKNDKYLAFAWNREDQLGNALVHGCEIGGSTSDAVERLAVRIAREYLTDLVANEDSNLSDAELQKTVDKILNFYPPILCGARGGNDDNQFS